ncbi:hypothetical protein MMC07_008175 [Pseudocyphellaria aurata]|nr:hypothetical protein [Pseudocyphellaria aurata]
MGSQTLRPGGPAISISGTAISLAVWGISIVIGGRALPFPAKTAPLFLVGSQLIATTSMSHSIASDKTLKAAAAASTSSGDFDIVSPDPILIPCSSSSPLLVTTSDASENAQAGSTSKSRGSRKGLRVVEQLMGLTLGVLRLTLL